MYKLNNIFKPNNSFLIASLVVIIYNLISPELFNLSAERVSYIQVFNAINGALNHKWAFITGLTTWTPLEEYSSGVYFVEIMPYLPVILAKLLFNMNTVLELKRIMDIGIIVGGISLFSEFIATKIIRTKSQIHEIVLKLLIASSFLVSPWTAYMLYKSTWHEPLFMMALISAMISLSRQNIASGTILLIIAGLIHNQFMFFMSIYFISASLIALFNQRRGNTTWRIPECVNIKLTKNYQKVLWSSIGIIMFFLHQVRKYISISLMDLTTSELGGSSAISRIGLDGNVHSGGLLGSLQFLGGYKWYYCFAIQGIDDSAFSSLNRERLSAIVNCELILLSTVVISAISIYGIIKFYNRKDKKVIGSNLWAINALIFIYLGMLLIFQQSFTVHIIGYSYVWGFIFAFGLSFFIYKTFIVRGLAWKIIGLIIFASCANTLIQASFRVSDIIRTSSYF